jgi:hypothetical protein
VRLSRGQVSLCAIRRAGGELQALQQHQRFCSFCTCRILSPPDPEHSPEEPPPTDVAKLASASKRTRLVTPPRLGTRIAGYAPQWLGFGHPLGAPALIRPLIVCGAMPSFSMTAVFPYPSRIPSGHRSEQLSVSVMKRLFQAVKRGDLTCRH